MLSVLSIEQTGSAVRDFHVEREIIGPDIEFKRHLYDSNEDRLIAACRNADVVLTDLAPLTRRVIEHMQRCRLISVAGTGYSNIDVEAAKEAGISVCAIVEYCTEEVADHVMLLILVLCRRFVEYHDQVQHERRWQADSLSGLRRMRDMTLGIIGFGKIGRAVARRARGFGMNIITHSISPDEREAADLNVTVCDMPTLLAQADIISLSCTLSKETEQLIDSAAFAEMRRSPILINCARGGLIDEQALVNALDTRQISGAGLDVLADEPPSLHFSKIAGRKNVIVTPHMAFYSDASMMESRRISAGNIKHFLDGNHDNVRRYIYRAKSN